MQFGKIVAGVLADVDFGSISGTISDPSPFFTGTIKQTLAWSVGARLGWLINPATLSYVNGGYSQTRFSGASMIKTDTGAPASAADGCAGCATPPFTHGGWFIGGGMEAMVSPGLFWRSEYRYADYGTTTLPDCSSVAPFSCALEPEIVFHPVVQTIRSELVYKFNWGGGPLSSRY